MKYKLKHQHLNAEDLNAEYLKNCIKYGVNNKLTRKNIIQGNLFFSLFFLITSIVGFVSNSRTRVYSTVICVLSISLIICCVLMTHRMNLKKRIIGDAFRCSLYIIIFVFESFIYLDVLMVPYYFLFSLLPILFSILSLFKMKKQVEQNKYIKGKKNFSWIIAATAAGGAMGYHLSRVLSDEMDQTTMGIILAIGSLFLACAFGSGITNFLKWHYIKILETKGVKLDG